MYSAAKEKFDEEEGEDAEDDEAEEYDDDMDEAHCLATSVFCDPLRSRIVAAEQGLGPKEGP